MSKSQSRHSTELSATELIDECIEQSEKNYQQLPAHVQQRVTIILSAFKTKSIKADSPTEIGDLIASLAELVPINTKLFSDLCESIAALCIDREFVQFADEALETVFNIILRHLESRTFDPSPGLRSLSTLLYNNTLRLVQMHERILEAAVSLANYSDDSYRRSCVLIGNLNAFSNKKNERSIYIRSIRFLLTALNESASTASTTSDLHSSALRSLQLLILDAPSEILDPQVLTHTISAIAFKQGQQALIFEAIMALKALANTSKKAFYAQWSILLTKTPSLFDLLRSKPKVAKVTADLLTDIFRDTWKFLYIADNTSKRSAFTTLAQQIGDIIDISFNRFMSCLLRTGKEKSLDPQVYNRVSKAFATFVRNCSFDNGRFKGGYIEKVIEWSKSAISATTEEALIVMKSLLWTDINYPPFASSFDYLFQTFIDYIGSENQNYSKPAAFALCRMAYAYPEKVVERYRILGPKMKEIGPVHALPIYLRLVEKGVSDLNIWCDLLQIFVPKSFEINHQKSIQRSLQCIGFSGHVFSKLPDNIQRLCLSLVLSNESEEACRSVGYLARSSAADISSVFLTDALLRLSSYNPPPLQPLSNVLESFATKHKDMFESKWIQLVFNCLEKDKDSPYGPRCIGFLFAFLNDPDNNSEEDVKSLLINLLITDLKSNDAKMRWNAAAAFSNAFIYNVKSSEAISILADYIDTDKIAKVKIRSAEALSNVVSREAMGDLYHRIFTVNLEQLLAPDHFTNLPLAAHRKYDAAYRAALTKLFFKLLDWSKASDFTSLEEPLVNNVDAIYQLMINFDHDENEEDNNDDNNNSNPKNAENENEILNNNNDDEDDFRNTLDRNDNIKVPWEKITRLYEARFNSIPSKMLEKFQDKAFPV